MSEDNCLVLNTSNSGFYGYEIEEESDSDNWPEGRQYLNICLDTDAQDPEKLDIAFRELYQNFRDGIVDTNKLHPSDLVSLCETKQVDADYFINVLFFNKDPKVQRFYLDVNGNEQHERLLYGYIQFRRKVNQCAGEVSLVNFNAKLPSSAFRIWGSSKSSPNQANRRGEGLKIAARNLCSAGHSLVIESESQVFRFKDSPANGLFVYWTNPTKRIEKSKAFWENVGCKHDRDLQSHGWEDVSVRIGGEKLSLTGSPSMGVDEAEFKKWLSITGHGNGSTSKTFTSPDGLILKAASEDGEIAEGDRRCEPRQSNQEVCEIPTKEAETCRTAQEELERQFISCKYFKLRNLGLFGRRFWCILSTLLKAQSSSIQQHTGIECFKDLEIVPVDGGTLDIHCLYRSVAQTLLLNGRRCLSFKGAHRGHSTCITQEKNSSLPKEVFMCDHHVMDWFMHAVSTVSESLGTPISFHSLREIEEAAYDTLSSVPRLRCQQTEKANELKVFWHTNEPFLEKMWRHNTGFTVQIHSQDCELWTQVHLFLRMSNSYNQDVRQFLSQQAQNTSECDCSGQSQAANTGLHSILFSGLDPEMQYIPIVVKDAMSLITARFLTPVSPLLQDRCVEVVSKNGVPTRNSVQNSDFTYITKIDQRGVMAFSPHDSDFLLVRSKATEEVRGVFISPTKNNPESSRQWAQDHGVIPMNSASNLEDTKGTKRTRTESDVANT